MMDWWNALSSIEHFFALVAIPATLLLLIQTILLLFGLGGGGHDTHMDAHGAELDVHTDFDTNDLPLDHDHDLHGYAEAGHDLGLQLFTIKGVVAFCSIFGWSGLACMQGGLGIALSLLISFAAGLLAMLAIAYIMKAALRLQVNGTVSFQNAIGKTATIYLRVPAERADHGKVNLVVQESYIEADAVTDENQDLLPGHEVVVVGLTGPNTLLVASKKKP